MLIAIVQKFCKEVIMWKSLDNPNVLPLLGATMSNKRFTMISEWMDNRNIGEFVKAHKSVNRFELVGSSYHSRLHPPLIMLLVAQRCHQRVSISTQTGSNTWGSEGGMILAIGNNPAV